MNNFIIYHNPKCSKSREALALLNEKSINPTIKEYLSEKLTKNEIGELLQKLKLEAKDIIRTKEDLFKELTIDLSNQDEVITALIKYPKLLERPIIVKGNQAVMGRPPENVLKLL